MEIDRGKQLRDGRGRRKFYRPGTTAMQTCGIGKCCSVRVCEIGVLEPKLNPFGPGRKMRLLRQFWRLDKDW